MINARSAPQRFPPLAFTQPCRAGYLLRTAPRGARTRRPGDGREQSSVARVYAAPWQNGETNRSCEHCGGAFPLVNPRKRFCSKRCGHRISLETERACPHCGNVFTPSSAKNIYCSKKCSTDSWHQRKPEEARAGCRSWRLRNLDKLREQKRAIRLANPEAVREYNRTYHLENKAAVTARQSAWKKAHPEAGREANQRRRARKMGAEGSHTPTEWQAICMKQGMKCADCRRPRKLTKDHVVPLSRGGTDFAYNIQGLCLSCNSKKRDKVVGYALASLFDRDSPVTQSLPLAVNSSGGNARGLTT